MNVTLIGATGYVGSHLLTELLNRGHHVTAVVRHPEKITQKHEHLKPVKADAMNEHEMAAAAKGQDAVISAYNAGWKNPNIYNDFIKGSDGIIKGVKKAGVKRLLVVGGAGSLEASPGAQLVDTPQFPAEWKQGAMAARDLLNTIRNEKELEWSFISPAIMVVSGERTAKFRHGTDQPVMDANGKSEISVQDLSVAIVDELEHPKHIRKRFTVGY